MEDATTHLKTFLQQKDRLLKLYIEDSLFSFEGSREIETFMFHPSQRVLEIPLSYFIEHEVEDDLVLWEIYNACALYPLYRKEPIAYYHRLDSYQNAIMKVAMWYQDKVKQAGLENDPAYQKPYLYAYAKKRIRYLLYCVDGAYRKCIVETKAMQYQNQALQQEIYAFLKEQHGFDTEGQLGDIYAMKLYRGIFDACELAEFSNVFQESFALFYRESLQELIDEEASLARLDNFIQVYLLDGYLEALKMELENMEVSPSTKEVKSTSTLEATQENQAKKNIEQEEKLIQQMQEEAIQKQNEMEKCLRPSFDYEKNGFQQEDWNLYLYYVQAIQKQREEMKAFWDLLIGHLQTERLHRVTNQTNGYLNVGTLIDQYPSFQEAQRKGTYKGIAVFDRFQYERKQESRPKQIDISFVIDNSGSMNHEKLEQARRAVTLVMLSLDDFRERLKEQGVPTKVAYEIYLYGTNFVKTKKLQDNGTKEDHQKELLQTIIEMKGTYGTTDDGEVLQDILHSITPAYEQSLKQQQAYRFVFEITDGASSFPGVSKQCVQKLIDQQVFVYGIEIGKKDLQAQKVFHYIFNEGYQKQHGIYLEEHFALLPETLIQCLKECLLEVF